MGDFFEDYVRDVFGGMGVFSDIKTGKVLDKDIELTDEQVKTIAGRFASRKDVSNLLSELDYICVDEIADELRKQGISY